MSSFRNILAGANMLCWLLLACSKSPASGNDPERDKARTKEAASSDPAPTQTGSKPVIPAASSATALEPSAPGTGTTQRYDVASGRLVLQHEGAHNGVETVYFKAFGSTELRETKTRLNLPDMPAMARAAGFDEEVQSAVLFENGVLHSWDPKQKTGTRIAERVVAANVPGGLSTPGNGVHLGRDLVRALNGTPSGTKSVAGLECKIWQVPAIKAEICEHQGVVLESTVEAAGLKQHVVATEASLAEQVPDTKFAVPADVTFKNVAAADLAKQGLDATESDALDKLLDE